MIKETTAEDLQALLRDGELCAPPARLRRRLTNQQAVFAAGWEGMARALRPRDAKIVELTLALDLVLGDPSVVDRWWAGDLQVFAFARIGSSPVGRAGQKGLHGTP